MERGNPQKKGRGEEIDQGMKDGFEGGLRGVLDEKNKRGSKIGNFKTLNFRSVKKTGSNNSKEKQ